MTRCATGRSSLFSGIVLILFGTLFLLRDRIPGLDLGSLIKHYWPVLLILWGVARLWDEFAARRDGAARPALVSGGDVGLIFLLLVVTFGFAGLSWLHHKKPGFDFTILPPFGETASATEELPPLAFKSGSTVRIDAPRGNITVYGDSNDVLRVVVTKSATAGDANEAHQLLSGLSARIDTAPGEYSISPSGFDAASGQMRVDLEVHAPPHAKVNASTGRGDIRVSDILGDVSAASRNGAIEIRHTGGDVTLAMQKGSAIVNGAAGNVRLTGRGDGVELSDIGADAIVEGDFFGLIRIEKVAKTVRFTSSRIDLTAVQLTGRAELNADTIEISGVSGSLKLGTREKDVQVENAAGLLDLSNSNGNIRVSYSRPPRQDITIVNKSAGVDLALPAGSAFQISAASRSGEIDNELDASALKVSNAGDTATLSGKIGAGGPRISITTTYGGIHLRKDE